MIAAKRGNDDGFDPAKKRPPAKREEETLWQIMLTNAQKSIEIEGPKLRRKVTKPTRGFRTIPHPMPDCALLRVTQDT